MYLCTYLRILKRLNSSDYKVKRDTTAETNEKSKYQAIRQFSLDLVVNSACPLIKIVMSHYYGTKEKCKEVNETLQEKDKATKSIQHLDEDKNESGQVYVSLQSTKLSDSENHWLTECKDVLTDMCPKDGKKWQNLSEDMKNWEPSACLSIIVHSKVIQGDSIFKSPLVNLAGDENKYDFVIPAQKIKEKLRNNDSHSSCKDDITKSYDEDIDLVFEFLVDLQKWYRENGCITALKYASDAYNQVKQKTDNLFLKKVPQWNRVYHSLKELDPNSACYLLLTVPLRFEMLTENQKRGLSSVPWCCIIDYDPNSSKEGFLKFFKEHQSQSISCESKTFHDMQRMDCDRHFGDLVDKLTSGHKCLSFLPHGDVENQSDKFCPLDDEGSYIKKVQRQLNRIMRFILERLMKSEKPPVVVFFCYDEYAIEGKHSPSFFHKSLNFLYMNAVDVIGDENVMFFTNRTVPFGDIAPCHMPLTLLCDYFHQSCSDLNCKRPILLPSLGGKLIQIDDIALILENFEVVHYHIAKYELEDKCKSQIKRIGGKSDDSNEKLKSKIVEETTIDFLRGNCISWIGLLYQIDIRRELVNDIKDKISSLQKGEMQTLRPTRIFELDHETGAGASTLARRILWELRRELICLILHENFSYTVDVVSHIEKLYEKCKCTILLLVDEDLQQYNTELLTNLVQSKSIPFILFRVTRTLQKSSKKSPSPDSSSFLGCPLSGAEAAQLKAKYKQYLSEQVVIKRENVFHEAEAFNVVGELVIAHNDHWSFCCVEGGHSIDGIVEEKGEDKGEEDIVSINWSDGTIEKCPLDTIQLKKSKDNMQSFMFYGIFYLLEEYRERIYNHVQRKLGELVSSDLQFLAYISLLFGYNACYSLPQACFGEGCYNFSIIDHVPPDACEFISVNKKGSFRIVHVIVAAQIIQFYSGKGNALSELVIDFLERFVPCDTSVNQKLRQAVSVLLWTRYFTHNDESSFLDEKKKRQIFSPLICELHREDAIKVLLKGTDIFDNSHSFGHLARYYAIEFRNFDEAKQCMQKAIYALNYEQSRGTICNMYGDVYRYELNDAMSKVTGEGDHKIWKYADELHVQACEKYRRSSKSNKSILHSYLGELKVRLDYLKWIRKLKFHNDQKMFMECLLTPYTNRNVLDSENRCVALLNWLEQFVLSGDGGKDIGSDNIGLIKKYQQALYDLMGEEKREEYISLAEELLKLPSTEINHPAVRRKYINLHLIHKNVEDIPEGKRVKMLKYLVDNIKEEGYKSDTMKYWINFSSSLPAPYSNVDSALRMLKEWEKRAQSSDIGFIKFYSYIFHFLAALNCSQASDQFDKLKKAYEKEEATCRRENRSEKTAQWIKKWIANDENGINCLQSGKWQTKSNLHIFVGKIGNIERDSKRRCYIGFKGFSIAFELKDLKSANNAKNGSKVQFGIGFSCMGVRAISISLIQENQFSRSTSIPQSAPNEHSTSDYISNSSSRPKESAENYNQGKLML